MSGVRLTTPTHLGEGIHVPEKCGVPSDEISIATMLWILGVLDSRHLLVYCPVIDSDT